MNRLLNNSDDKHSSACHQYEISSMISRLRNVKNLSIIDLSKQASVDIKFIEDVETGVYNDCFDQITRIIEQLGYKMDFVKKLYFLVSNKYPEVKSNLLETIMEMNNLDVYYERVE